MKSKIFFISLILVLLIPLNALALYILDTGQPPSVRTGATLSPNQWIAHKFTISEEYTLTVIEGWMYDNAIGPLRIVVYGNGGDVPDVTNILYSKIVTLAPNQVPGHPPDWYSISGINWNLPAGTYWVAFEVSETSAFDWAMPFNDYYDPELNMAICNPGIADYHANFWWHIGLRIQAEPVQIQEGDSLILLSGDTNITDPLVGAQGAPIDLGNQQFFINILQGGNRVAVLETTGSWKPNLSVNTFYNTIPGVTSTVISSVVSDAQLSEVDLFVSAIPNDAFTESEIVTLDNFLASGGTIFFLGEHKGFSQSNQFINDALTALGSDMEITAESVFDSGVWFTAKGIQIGADHFMAGVTTFTYTAPSQVNGGKFLFFGTAGQPFVAYEIKSFFTDVPPGYWAEKYIYKIFNAGITTGCSKNPLKYCPERSVTRDQMAVFLTRGIHGSSFTPPLASGIFYDVSVWYWAADWIEQFYKDGITSGCTKSPLRYCPTSPVTRAQMAIFLLRSKYGESYKPPKATGIFTDVPVSYWAADWIEQLYKEGITTGCQKNPLRYCPESSVTRAQMAVFIVRTFGL